MNEHPGWAEVTRARNILTLEERVRAIREFDRTPIYQKVADVMNCSAKQIRNIVQNRESILLYYASKTGEFQGGVSKHKDRQEKIELLNRVMYEWILRTQSRENLGRISTKLIRTIALDVKNHLKVPSFYPNGLWLENFLETYNMTEDDLCSQTLYSRCGQSKEHLSLKISDIVDDVRDPPVKLKPANDLCSPPQEKRTTYEYKPDDNDNSSSETGDDYNEIRVVIEHDDDQSESEYIVAPSNKIRKVENKKNNSVSNGEKTIENYEEALRHLKPLEDFVLMEENFRAIGVISQLEAIFKNPNKYLTD